MAKNITLAAKARTQIDRQKAIERGEIFRAFFMAGELKM